MFCWQIAKRLVVNKSWNACASLGTGMLQNSIKSIQETCLLRTQKKNIRKQNVFREVTFYPEAAPSECIWQRRKDLDDSCAETLCLAEDARSASVPPQRRRRRLPTRRTHLHTYCLQGRERVPRVLTLFTFVH